MLNDPITEEELLPALKQVPNGKSPGTDGLPSVYGQYTKQVMPTLLKVYNEALESGRLPQYMNDAIIVVQTNVDSFLPVPRHRILGVSSYTYNCLCIIRVTGQYFHWMLSRPSTAGG